MTHLVLGLGEIGSAIQKILGSDGYDPKVNPDKDVKFYDVLHICFPYSAEFVKAVKMYERELHADLVIVHSTVPVGTCDENGWVHSPVRGVHPDLELGIRTFVKFFGGAQSSRAAGIFSELGIKTYGLAYAKNTEALKLWDTTIYGMNILIEKGIAAYCEKHGLDFETVYTLANATYNEGYAMLGKPQFSKYVLAHKDGPIGGHCVIPNAELLDHPLAEILILANKELLDS